MSKTLVVAEAACTHDGNLVMALELIAMAKQAGADCIKFQWCSNPAKMAARRHVDDPSVYALLNFPVSWHAVLSETAHAAGLEYLCTVFLAEDIPTIAPFVDRFKVASLEANDREFLEAHISYQKPIIVSTGAMSEFDIEQIDSCAWSLLHCVSAYPAPLAEMNLRCLFDSPETGRIFAGLSDHSAHVLTGAFAVCAGATIVEVHFRHPMTSEKNPDYGHSLEINQLCQYIANIRLAETMLGSGEKTIQPSEQGLVKHRVTA